mmetsp:Transcript_12939/g.22994  ORF Transcript_12939/g.22994 Transcript_12939/m.22994 type:complete len:133 (-) Transcript_12939:162-560(-)|eukprot:CAMPEP_0184515302 /NCGR_PEP_ID=MMETSP0198_2-20121128/4423_1 /TAXON_ID=1112570 /ORGANISM="Thraustochytrium sp., Strain LLF1b" /LENGTH=132 /DNA_ID=CAMNT_0026905547 /DNA_START=39 /DNA_END=437 /DNA_ORIENTATION=+
MSDFEDDVDEDMGAAEYAAVPDVLKSLRACIPCLLIKTYRQFFEDGCENCPHLSGMGKIDMKGVKEDINNITTTEFDGFVAIPAPDESWVARWIGVTKLLPGIYATRVHTDLPEMYEDPAVRNLGRLSKERV